MSSESPPPGDAPAAPARMYVHTGWRGKRVQLRFQPSGKTLDGEIIAVYVQTAAVCVRTDAGEKYLADKWEPDRDHWSVTWVWAR